MDFLFLYSTVFNPSDRLERFKFESFPTPTRLLWKVFSHGAITARRLFLQICPPLSVAWHSCIQLIELGYYGENENAQASKWLLGGFKPRLPQMRVLLLPLGDHAPHYMCYT